MPTESSIATGAKSEVVARRGDGAAAHNLPSSTPKDFVASSPMSCTDLTTSVDFVAAARGGPRLHLLGRHGAGEVGALNGASESPKGVHRLPPSRDVDCSGSTGCRTCAANHCRDHGVVDRPVRIRDRFPQPGSADRCACGRVQARFMSTALRRKFIDGESAGMVVAEL